MSATQAASLFTYCGGCGHTSHATPGDPPKCGTCAAPLFVPSPPAPPVQKALRAERKRERKQRRQPWVPLPTDPPEPDVVLTHALLHAGGTKGGVGWSAKQLRALGVRWPPKKGWLSALIGKTVSGAAYRRFLELRGK